MAFPERVTRQRAEAASAADAELALLIMAVPRLYASLTRRQARVVIQRADMRGASWAEVAAALGLSRTAARNRWRRVTRQLPGTIPELEQVRARAMDTRLWNQAS
jgi:DNA-directed RNA polymerase specialized sigma24 family protein